MITKGEWEAAIRFAAKFPRLGSEAEAITRASSAILSPGFYRSLGQDPDEIINKGRAALIRRYHR